MSEAFLEHAVAIRLLAYGGILALMAFWEGVAPRRARTLGRSPRWVSNLGIAALNTLVLRVFLAVAPLTVAFAAADRSLGLFHLDCLQGPYTLPLGVLATVVLLDLAIYAQHVVFHKVPVLWRLHRMHHADPDIDVTTGARFHTIEIVLSGFYKSALVLALGAPPEGVLAFEILLNATAMFNHANVRLPARLDRALRLVLVTPDMHRVHHSVHRDETDSNYGFSMPWWDRLFGTYREAPRDGHEGMTIGLERFRTETDQRIDRLLVQPFAGEPSERKADA